MVRHAYLSYNIFLNVSNCLNRICASYSEYERSVLRWRCWHFRGDDLAQQEQFSAEAGSIKPTTPSVRSSIWAFHYLSKRAMPVMLQLIS